MLTDDETAVHPDAERRYRQRIRRPLPGGPSPREAAKGKPIASLFELPKRGGDGRKLGKVKTEILFIERCLALLKPGGRMGIVLPEGIFNNPSLAYVREFCEDRARVLAVVSLPQETFYSSGAIGEGIAAVLEEVHRGGGGRLRGQARRGQGRSRSQVCRRNRGGNGPAASGNRSGEGGKGPLTPARRRNASLPIT